ncbi:MAG: SPOR domain-containing protein, partial [Arenicella sp.]|nr:SPOR domain-containing protein [Arenicella sp.]
FLLFFGALFVPWLLGPPSVAVKTETEGLLDVQAETSSIEIENDLLEVLQNEQQVEADEEPVYISKITPLNTSPSSAAEESDGGQQTRNGASGEPASVVENPSVAAVRSPLPAAARAEVASPDSKSEPEPEDAAADIDVGWAVQVGIYTNPVGVSKVLADLRAKGFKPSTTVVDTNQGKATGTRVWLGPYAQRVDAAKAKALLTEKTGEAGFIRIYP